MRILYQSGVMGTQRPPKPHDVGSNPTAGAGLTDVSTCVRLFPVLLRESLVFWKVPSG